MEFGLRARSTDSSNATRSFTPECYDAIGFGPLAISTFTDLKQCRAVKLVRSKVIDGGLWNKHDLYFECDETDLRLLFLTRSLARLAVSRSVYHRTFGADVLSHFPEAIEAIEAAGLATLDAEAIRLTPRGSFFADSVTGLLAWPRVEQIRALGRGQRTKDVLRERLRVMDDDFMG